jgi:DNA repair exonuclease SbcCD ATPase subunit
MLRHAEEVAEEIGEREQADHQRRAVLLSKALVLEGQIAQAKTERQVQRERVVAEIAELRARLDTAEVHRRQQTVQLTLLPKLEPRPVSRYADREAVWQVRQQRDLLVSQIEAERGKPNPHQGKIDGLQATLVEIDYASLNELTLHQKHEGFLHRLLTSKDSFVRKRIVDQNLSFLNKRLDHYLQRLGLPHEVVFQPDLTVEIDLLGRSYDFEQLSRGEMNRVILATSWAFRDVYESLNTTLNLLLVDEMLDQGTDGAGVEAALDILAGMAAERHRSVFLISHRDELRDRIDHVLTVRKENQFTVFT